jgi:hypothetical protein
MSVFPRSDPSRRDPAAAEPAAPLGAEGVLARPIGGLIYLIEEDELAPMAAEERSPLSGLVSRH